MARPVRSTTRPPASPFTNRPARPPARPHVRARAHATLNRRYGLVGVCGAVVGTKGAKALVEKTGRSSMLVFILAFLLFGSGALMLATGSVQLMRSGLTGFRSLCGRAGAAAAND